jgi:hypothetical protein
MRLRFTCLFAVVGSLAYGQLGSVAGPSAGYVFDPAAQMVRQIRGIAGAATLGDPVDFGMTVAGAKISPRGDVAVVSADDGSAHLFRIANGAARELTTVRLGAVPTVAFFSPGGTAVALYRSDGVQVLRGLPDAPEVAFTASIRTQLFQPATSAVRLGPVPGGTLAVSDDATVLLHCRAGSVAVITAAGARKLADTKGPAAIALAPQSHDVAVVTGGTLSVYKDVTGASTRQDFPNASAVAGVAFSVDGSKVLMAGLRAVTVLEQATGDTRQVACDCRIGGLSPMGAMFRLNEAGDGPVWLVDASGADPRLVFVPARVGE